MPGGRRILLALLALGAVGGLLVWWLVRADPVPVRLAVVERGLVESTVSNTRAGTVMACQRARIAPAIGGRIDTLPVDEGDRVEAGALLMELWNDDIEARLTLAEREHASAVAKGEQACVRAHVAREESDRQVALHKQGIASDERMRRLVAEAKAQRAACTASREAGRVAEAQIDVARATLEKTRLRAPFSGIVAEINGELGEFVTPSPIGIPTPPTIDLIDTTCLYVSAPIDEVDAASIRTGMVARISLDAFAQRTFAGHVQRIAPYVLDVEKQARTVDVEVEFDDVRETTELLVGYSADIEIVLATAASILRVPTEAILEGPRVLVNEDGTLVERRIETGLSNWRFTEARTGVDAGEEVVLSVDREGVEAGASVRADESPEDP